MSNMILAGLSLLALTLRSEAASPSDLNSWPQNYTGIPDTDYGTDWQRYFHVTGGLPNVTANMSSYAGSISVNRTSHPNNTLFFWAYEKFDGSLKADVNSTTNAEPWIIWLNGGPGTSSLLGLLTENGPLLVNSSTSGLDDNVYSWSTLADSFWVDQPVGTGYSTVDSTGFVANEDQVGEDFVGFLSNLVKVFPNLAQRPLYLIGQSYAGVYIPYIAKALFSLSEPPVDLRKIVIGDGTLGSLATFEELPALSVIETYPQLIGYDTDVYNYFKEQTHLCGYDLNLTYPQNGTFAPLINPFTTIESATPGTITHSKRSEVLRSMLASGESALTQRDLEARNQWKRDLSNRPNGTLDPYYGCFLFDEMIAYAQNYSFPYASPGTVDRYDLSDAVNPLTSSDPTVFLNDNKTKTAIHAPVSKNWTASIPYPFDSTYTFSPNVTNEWGDPSVEPAAFLSELATNATDRGVSMVFFVGNNDPIIPHRGTEVVIQNTTFGGTQGFVQQPSTPWYNDDGTYAGIVHQERNITYVLFKNAGHLVASDAPKAALTFLREFVLGSNTTGLVDGDSVDGGEGKVYLDGIIPGTVISYGNASTTLSTVEPSATVASWLAFLEEQTATETSTVTSGGSGSTGSSSSPSTTATSSGSASSTVVESSTSANSTSSTESSSKSKSHTKSSASSTASGSSTKSSSSSASSSASGSVSSSSTTSGSSTSSGSSSSSSSSSTVTARSVNTLDNAATIANKSVLFALGMVLFSAFLV